MADTRKRRARLVYQLKITLLGIKPPIWRRIQVTGETSLHQLHWIIQTSMGWGGGHLHEFHIFGDCYGDPVDLMDQDTLDEKKAKLNQLISAEKERFLYIYDFGDGWEHDILVEKIVPQQSRARFPICLKGRRACPPENCGGPWGYVELLEAIKDPSAEDHEEILEWLEDSFDPDHFDLEEINRRLQPSPRSGYGA
jgi:hypothetical protein